MRSRPSPKYWFLFVGTALFLTSAAQGVRGEPFTQGAEACQNCHTAEYDVWTQTQHYASFREVHKNPKAKEVLAAVGGSPNMKANETCVLCHYTLVQDAAGAAPVAKSGPSCERCHGASSDWINIHNDYGGADVTRETEPPEHRAKRITDAQAAGWLHPGMKYGIASNCMSCHGLAHPVLGGETVAKMLDAGHPIEPDFELVRYSQGTVRHRFYPPETTVNAEMTPAELSRLFVIGQAAKLVSAMSAQAKSKHPVYQEAQKKRAADATAALSAVTSVPEAAALVAKPTEENARKLEVAIAGKDLSGEVQALVPDKSTYK